MPAQPAERPTGTATILFTDLVGSTAQRARLGEEAAEALRRAHDRLLAEAVGGHHGTVAKSTGDGIMATFPGAAEAVGAAVAIQQAVEGHNRRVPTLLAVRIGISLGDVTWEGTDCFGTPVIEAARLCAVAEGGQILAAELVRLTARGRGGYTFTPIGPVALKGLPEPVVACAVVWEPLADAGLPLPPRLGPPAAFAMFGRGAQAEALGLAWAKAKDGQRQVVLLAGEPGIGKTRLATETARAAHAEGGTVLFGACDEDVGLPYRPFVEALRHYVAHAPEAVLAAHVQTHRGELARLVPELGRRLAGLPPPQVAEAETERFLLFEAVAGLLAVASQESPIVLVLDDVHWAGAPELLLLKHLIRSSEPMRLLVIGTYRDTDLSRTHPLTTVLADLRREAGCERVSLHGLDDAAVETLVAAVARHDLDEALVALAHAIRGETEGNPFFIGEVIRHLVESGALFEAGGRWTYRGEIAGLGIPEGVREVIGRRLGRLSDATSRMLTLAAVVGRQFDVALLAKVAEKSEDAVLDAMDEAITAALVTEVRGSPEQFTFRHALIRSTLYEELSAPRRARLHQRVGEALEALVGATPGARIEELAYHWLAATRAADAGKAIGYTRQAGERALAGLAFEEAAAHFERALGVLEPRDSDGERLRCDLLLALGDAQTRAGDSNSARGTFQRAADIARKPGAAEQLARAALGFGGRFVWWFGAADDVLTSLLEETLCALGEADSALRVRVMARLATALYNQSPGLTAQAGVLDWRRSLERAALLSQQAAEMARRLGDVAALAYALDARYFAIWGPDGVEERLATATEMIRVAEEAGDRERAHQGHHWRMLALLELGEVRAANVEIQAQVRLAEELRQPAQLWYTAVVRAMRALFEGGFEEGDRLARQALGIGQQAQEPVARALFRTQMYALSWAQGRLQEHEAAQKGFVERHPESLHVRSGLAHLYSELGRAAEARKEFEHVAAKEFADLPRDLFWMSAAARLSEVSAFLGDARRAETLYELLLPYGDRNVVTPPSACFGSASRYLGLLATTIARWEEAAEHFENALAMNTRMGARPWVARTQHDYAAMLLARDAPGDREKALALVTQAADTAQELGMKSLVEKAMALKVRAEGIASGALPA